MTHADRQRIYRVAIWLTKVMPVAISLVYVANTVCAFMGYDVPLFSWVAAMSLLPLILFYVQSHICRYYHVEEDSEQAAYLIGYIVQKMHDFFRYKISTGRE